MRTDVDRAMRRARGYWYEDGLTEIAAGCILSLVGLLFLAEAVSPPDLLPTNFSSIGLIVVVVGGGWLARRVVAALKARLTYPRTGYVAYRRPSGRRRVATVVLAAGMAALAAVLFATAPASLAWIPALQGLIVGILLLYVGHTVGLARFYALAALSAVVGAAASLAGLGDILGDAVYFGAMGLALVVSGGITFLAYLSRNRPPSEA